MANQPKKYTKFVATAATATLVASAIVPVASAAGFSDVADTNSHAKNINALVEAGIIGGYPDGTFKPNQELTRGQVVKMLGKWVEKQGFEIPADYATKARFTDLAADAKDQELVKYAALVFDNGVFGGSNGALNASGKITRENMALVLDRAFKAINDTTLVEVAADMEDVKVADLATAKAEAREAIQALRNLGISGVENFMPKNSVTRGQFASFLNKTINTEAVVELTVKEAKAVDANTVEVTLSDDTKHTVKLEKALEANKETEVTFKIGEKEYTAKVTYTVALESVKAINAKTIEVKFNTAVDSTKVSVELLRGSFKQNVTLTWAEDKKSVQLTGASNFQAADYTVNVSGLTTEVLTGSVKIEAQKVAAIEILDEVAVVNKAVDASTGVFADDTIATVTYVVKDQYGTDMTKTTNLTTNDSKTIELDAKNGVVKLSGAAVKGKKVGDLVPVVLIDTNSGISTTKTVKLSAESTVSTIAVTGVFNKKGEAVALNDASKASEAFIVLDLKDQYGKEIKDVKKATGLVITNTNETNLDINKTVTTKEINGVEKLVIELNEIKKAGNTDILLISTTNGQSAKYTVAVAETSVSDAISVSQPEIAVAGETTLIPVTVTDKQGNVITDKKLLASATKGIKVSGEKSITEASFEVKDGQVFFKKNFDAEGKQALVFQTANYKVATVTVDVKAEAKPAVVRGVKNPIVISTAQKTLPIITKDHLVIEDQYGRIIKDSAAVVKVEVADDKKVISVENNTITALKNGTTKVVISLATPYEKIDSAVEVPVRVTDGKEYEGYEIKTIGKKQVGKVDFTVNGLLNNGKVALDASEYTATIEGGTITKPEAVKGGTFTFTADKHLNTKSQTDDTKVDTEFTLKVTVNATGQVLEQKFVVSADTPKVQDFFFTTSEVNSEYDLAKAITDAVLEIGTEGNKLVSNEKAVVIAYVDQYGTKKVAEVPAASTITIVPTKASEVTITDNGTNKPSVELVGDTKESVVTLKVTVDGVTKELKATVVPAKAPASIN